MQKFSNMPLSEVASAAVPAARRVAVPTAKPASLSAEALNIPRSGIRDVFDRVERVPDAISLTVGEPSATAAPHIVAAACEPHRLAALGTPTCSASPNTARPWPITPPV
mgnify:CR=1 FL=1